NAGQHAAEADQPRVLVGVAERRPTRVVAELLAPARITTRGLHVTARGRADPHIDPRWRNGERANAGEHCPVAHLLALRVPVLESPSVSITRVHGVGVRLIGELHRRLREGYVCGAL